MLDAARERTLALRCRRLDDHIFSLLQGPDRFLLPQIGNGADGISDIEGKATRVGASERGQQTSFNGAEGSAT